MNYALLSIMGAYDVLWNSEGQTTTNRIWYKMTRLTVGSVLSPSRDHSVLKQSLSLGSSQEMKESQEEQMQKHSPSSLKETLMVD